MRRFSEQLTSSYAAVAAMGSNERLALLIFTTVAVFLAHVVPCAAGANSSYSVTLNRAVPSTGGFDCGQTDSDGKSRNFCIACAPAGGVRAIAAACNTIPGCVAFDVQREAGRCAYLKNLVPSLEGLQPKPGYTHYCKLDGSGRCKTGEFLWKPGLSIPTIAGNDMNCAPTPDRAPSSYCSQCHNQTLNATRGLCSVCGVDKMLETCAANPACAAVEYVQTDSCGRLKVAAGPLVAAESSNLYIKIATQAAGAGGSRTPGAGAVGAAGTPGVLPANGR